MQAYCFKCQALREAQAPRQVTLKNGRRAVQGACAVCGGKVFRIIKANRT